MYVQPGTGMCVCVPAVVRRAYYPGPHWHWHASRLSYPLDTLAGTTTGRRHVAVHCHWQWQTTSALRLALSVTGTARCRALPVAAECHWADSGTGTATGSATGSGSDSESESLLVISSARPVPEVAAAPASGCCHHCQWLQALSSARLREATQEANIMQTLFIIMQFCLLFP